MAKDRFQEDIDAIVESVLRTPGETSSELRAAILAMVASESGGEGWDQSPESRTRRRLSQ